MRVPRRLFPMLLVGAFAVTYLSIAPHWPADQHLRILLGDRARRVEELTVRCAQKGGEEGEWTREVTFRYAAGQAPRIVSYVPRLAGGEYLAEIEVRTEDGHVETTERHIQLAGGTTSIDLAASSVEPSR